MLADEVEQRLFVLMLERSIAGEGPKFELETLNHDHGVGATRAQLRDFSNNNHGHYGSKEPSEMHVTRFELNSEGVRKAKEYQELIRPKSLKDRFASVNRSDWIALGAFLVSLIALFK